MTQQPATGKKPPEARGRLCEPSWQRGVAIRSGVVPSISPLEASKTLAFWQLACQIDLKAVSAALACRPDTGGCPTAELPEALA